MEFADGTEIEKEWKQVSKEEWDKFLKEYPTRLEYDFYMDYVSYNDFSLGVWSDSVVATYFNDYLNHKDEYRICVNFKELREAAQKHGIKEEEKVSRDYSNYEIKNCSISLVLHPDDLITVGCHTDGTTNKDDIGRNTRHSKVY